MRRKIYVLLFIIVFTPLAARAEDIVTVELFTSQGCSSCLPADEYMEELADRTDVVALSYHVDYWNKMISFDGNWRDPFSKPEWTARQKDYSELIAGAGNPSTPQIIVDGRDAETGTKKEKIEKLIEKARVRRDADFEITRKKIDAGTAEITLNGNAQVRALRLMLARFTDRTETEVNAGENKGKKIVNRHVVTSLTPIGVWYGGRQSFRYATDSVSGCAILLQDKVSQQIVTAQYCMP